jgi:hypothetical protein
LVISTDALNALVKLIGARRYKNKYIVDCRKKFDFAVEIQGQKFKLDSKSLMFKIGKGYCQLAINDNSSGLWSQLWILGDPFYRSFCLTHNFNRSIGVSYHRE